MSAPATITTLKPLAVVNSQLQFGSLQLPVGSIKTCWVYPTDNKVFISLSSQKGNEYKTILMLCLSSADKVKECIKVLITQTNTHICIPLHKVEDTALVFESAHGANVFAHYYAPAFFPTFTIVEHKFTPKGDLSQIEHTIKALQGRMSSGSSEWAEKESAEKYERSFDVTADEVYRVTWKNFVRTATPSNVSEIQAWLNADR
jgi:hypothetical protein